MTHRRAAQVIGRQLARRVGLSEQLVGLAPGVPTQRLAPLLRDRLPGDVSQPFPFAQRPILPCNRPVATGRSAGSSGLDPGDDRRDGSAELAVDLAAIRMAVDADRERGHRTRPEHERRDGLDVDATARSRPSPARPPGSRSAAGGGGRCRRAGGGSRPRTVRAMTDRRATRRPGAARRPRGRRAPRRTPGGSTWSFRPPAWGRPARTAPRGGHSGGPAPQGRATPCPGSGCRGRRRTRPPDVRSGASSAARSLRRRAANRWRRRGDRRGSRCRAGRGSRPRVVVPCALVYDHVIMSARSYAEETERRDEMKGIALAGNRRFARARDGGGRRPRSLARGTGKHPALLDAGRAEL